MKRGGELESINIDPILGDLAKNHLPALFRILETVIDSLDVRTFTTVINIIVGSTAQKFKEATDKLTLLELDTETQSKFTEFLVRAINNNLPTQYPLVIAILFIENEKEPRIEPIPRKQIPGWREIIDKDICPIARVKRIEDK